MKNKIFIIFLLFIFISCNSIPKSNNNELLSEYKLLYTDLENLYTYGYKSYYSSELNKATPIINAGYSGQGSLLKTGIPTDFAIMGEGFVKIKLDNNKIGYTRNGNFIINSNSEFVTNDGFPLFEPIIFPKLFLPDKIKINRNGYIFVSIPKNNGELIELEVGRLNIYKIPTELLEYYKDGIYTLKVTTNSEIIIDDDHIRIFGEFLELSNYQLLPVLLRMYYILSKPNNKSISNIEFKKELMKSIIDNVINTQKYTIEEYNHRKYLMETAYIPFLRYDY